MQCTFCWGYVLELYMGLSCMPLLIAPSHACSWRALEVTLRTAVDAGGDMAAYRQQRWKQGKWWWWLGPGGTMQLAGKGRFTQMRCPPSMAGGDASPAAGAAAEAAH